MSCGVGCRCSSGPVLLWLLRRLVATAPIRPLAWEPQYAAGAAQRKGKNTKKKKKVYKISLCDLFIPLFYEIHHGTENALKTGDTNLDPTLMGCLFLALLPYVPLFQTSAWVCQGVGEF